MKLDLYLTPYTKQIRDQNIKTKTKNSHKKNISVKSLQSWIRQWFLRNDTKCTSKKIIN